MPDRKISICKELTKVNEFVFRGIPNKVKSDILQKKLKQNCPLDSSTNGFSKIYESS